ncbi:MAG: rhodanese-like domain-containing protein [Anaerolineaceae bacterium]|nr:rhodanese-like domain-containing protein [Anaerolineaceae bacterium]
MNLFALFRRNDINREIDDFRNIPDAVLLDVRSEEEYMSGHIPQSVNIPLDKISNIQNVVKKKTPLFLFTVFEAQGAEELPVY